MTVRFGDQQRFAIEYKINQIQPHMMGHVRIWFGGIAVGYFEEETMVSCAQGKLTHRARNLNALPISAERLAQLSNAKIFSFIGSLLEGGMFMMNLGESFDDFGVYAFRNGDMVQFLWKLSRKPFHRYPGYPKGVQSALVEIEYFVKVVQEGDLFLRNFQETIG